jgi:uncharacterized membrane protein
MSARTVLVVTSIVSSGLMAGLFFGWQVSVIPGTRRIGDRNYVETMQQINIAIVNPAFVIPFIATPFLLAGAGIVEYRAGNQRRGLTLGSAAAIYVVGLLGVTVGANIPLNKSLDAFDLGDATDSAVADERAGYEGPWNRWHGVRTTASVVASTVAASAALIAESADG